MITSTITVSDTNFISEGSDLGIDVDDNRWWINLFYFITFRKRPMKQELYRVVSVDSETTITIAKKEDMEAE